MGRERIRITHLFSHQQVQLTVRPQGEAGPGTETDRCEPPLSTILSGEIFNPLGVYERSGDDNTSVTILKAIALTCVFSIVYPTPSITVEKSWYYIKFQFVPCRAVEVSSDDSKTNIIIKAVEHWLG